MRNTILTKFPDILLGLDFGLRKIGVAIGQRITQSATALKSIPAQKGTPDWKTITDLINLWHIDAFIVGIPYNMDGSDQYMTQAARHFAKELENRFCKQVYLMDERLTTVEARHHFYKKDLSLAKTTTDIDSIAAKLILESWLQQHGSFKGDL